MQNFLVTILTCSITMSALALFYMAVTPLLEKRYSAKGRYYTWLIIVMGLIIPFRPQFGNPFVEVAMPSEAAMPTIQFGNMTPITVPIGNTALAPSPASIPWWQIAVMVWLAGAIIFIANNGIKHYRFVKMVKRWSERDTSEQTQSLVQSRKNEMGVSRKIDVYRCSSVGSPMMIGFVNARLLLPKADFPHDELCFIIKHEFVHYKRKDLYYKALVLLATAIHWFNPIVYLIAKTIDIQCELSCDAETVRSNDADTRRQYSETIIGVVKHQSKLKAALSTNFYGGKKGMKKRIFSIMDTGNKKAGAAILCCVLVLTMGTGVALAAQSTSKSEPSADIEDNDEPLNAMTVIEGNQPLMSRTHPITGEKIYSRDGGKTWTEDNNAALTSPAVEWWTYDEYKVWMEEQIAGLQALADDGVPDYYDKDGVLRDFTQADVDEATAMYQSTLEDIKSGVKVSKTVDGSIETIMSYNPSDVATIHENDIAVGTTYAVGGNSWSDNEVEPNYGEYAQFGITYRDKKLYYYGEPVRCFDDWYSLGEDMYAGRSFFDKDGTVDVYAERDFSQMVHNPDGSYDPSGKLVGVRASGKAEFDARDLSQYNESAAPSGTTDVNHISAYSAPTSGELSSVATGNTFTINASSDGGTHTSSGRTIAETFEDYAAFGVTFNTKSVNGGLGNVYYDGKLVKQFTDIAPNGGVFSCSSSDGGAISLRTVYDANGEIIGVEVVGN